MINCHYLGPYHLIPAHSMLSKIVPRSRVTVRSALLNTADVYLNGGPIALMSSFTFTMALGLIVLPGKLTHY